MELSTTKVAAAYPATFREIAVYMVTGLFTTFFEAAMQLFAHQAVVQVVLYCVTVVPVKELVDF